MKTFALRAVPVLAVLVLPVSGAFGQQPAVGYITRTFVPGDNLFVNPFVATPNNNLSTIIPMPPDGTTVSLWNPSTLSYDTTLIYLIDSGWLNYISGNPDNITLNPGIGARLTTPSQFTVTFSGELQNRMGDPFYPDDDPNAPPPPYAGPNGIFLLGDKLPFSASGNDIFLNLLGRAPNVGEQVITLTTTSTYLGAGAWNVLPAMDVSDAVFLNVGPSTYSAWIGTFSLAAGDQNFTDDPDGDRLSNGIEAFFGTNPNVGSTGLTQLTKGGNIITFQHPNPATSLGDVAGSYRWSPDMIIWYAVDGVAGNGSTTVTAAATANSPSPNTTTVVATIGGTVPATIFLRAEATTP